MSAGGDDYIETYNPDGDVLWVWYEKWHCQAATQNNLSAETTRLGAKRCINRFEKFLAGKKGNYDCHWTDIDTDRVSYEDIIPPRSVTPQIAEEFLKELVSNYAPKTQQNTYTTLKQAYEWCSESVEPVEIDPFQKVYKKHAVKNGDWFLESPSGRDPHIISLSEARKVVRQWNHPLWTTVQLLLAKIPKRAGAISNLDFEDVSITHPGCNWTVHPDLRRWDDHIIFRSEKRQSDKTRNTGNKTKTDSKIPIDKELRDALLWYLCTRPQPNSPSDPLFLTVSNTTRLSGKSISNKFIRRAKKIGYFYGSNHDDNLNPHYWRHWGTTHYEDQFGGDADTPGNTSMTDYLRGDSREGIKQLYNNYSSEKRDIILNAMPTFLKPYTDD
jgi:integrase